MPSIQNAPPASLAGWAFDSMRLRFGKLGVLI